MQETLNKYVNRFDNKNLKLGITKYGKAPHKVIMLLSVLQAFESNLVTQNRIYVSPELVAIFRSIWNKLVITNNVCNFALPFWHLKEKNDNKRFWHPIAKHGYEILLNTKESVSSLNELNTSIDYVSLSEDLFRLMLDKTCNTLLQEFLLTKYFPDTKSNIENSLPQYGTLISNIENKILHESPEEYRKEIKHLITQQDEEEIFLRGSLFKREIPKLYDNTCCISGMRIDASMPISMIDACHIVPFSVSYDDTITNGIALCPNLHRAFDRGLIAIDENYKVIVSKSFKEDETSYSIKRFEGKEILLPKMKDYYPLVVNFRWHRNNVFK